MRKWIGVVVGVAFLLGTSGFFCPTLAEENGSGQPEYTQVQKKHKPKKHRKHSRKHRRSTHKAKVHKASHKSRTKLPSRVVAPAPARNRTGDE